MTPMLIKADSRERLSLSRLGVAPHKRFKVELTDDGGLKLVPVESGKRK